MYYLIIEFAKNGSQLIARSSLQIYINYRNCQLFNLN